MGWVRLPRDFTAIDRIPSARDRLSVVWRVNGFTVLETSRDPSPTPRRQEQCGAGRAPETKVGLPGFRLVEECPGRRCIA